MFKAAEELHEWLIKNIEGFPDGSLSNRQNDISNDKNRNTRSIGKSYSFL